MPSLLIAGSGQIGRTIGQLLTQADMDYQVVLADLAPKVPEGIHLNKNLSYVSLDIKNNDQFKTCVKAHHIEAVISCLPYSMTLTLAKLAQSLELHYFDLTEDVEATKAITQLASQAKTAFVPQCGVAPGFINIIANHLMKSFEKLDSAQLRCGALPVEANNALQYALTWSIDGLINEYANPCPVIADGITQWRSPLEDLENTQVDGACYEAFNTSGGLGSLIELYQGKINHLNYKTLRYPGHCEKMHFLINALKLGQKRDVLKNILQDVLPYTQQDVVLISVSVQGYEKDQLQDKTYVRKFYPCVVNDQPLTAIQMTTASAACTVIDLILTNPNQYQGLIHQAAFDLDIFLNNRFAQYFSNNTSNGA